jgi:hypothetical protein
LHQRLELIHSGLGYVSIKGVRGRLRSHAYNKEKRGKNEIRCQTWQTIGSEKHGGCESKENEGEKKGRKHDRKCLRCKKKWRTEANQNIKIQKKALPSRLSPKELNFDTYLPTFTVIQKLPIIDRVIFLST